MQRVRYNTEVLKDVLAEAFPMVPRQNDIGVTKLIAMAALDHFVGRLALSDYQLRLLQSAQIDLNENAAMVFSKPEEIEEDRIAFEGNHGPKV